MLSKRIHPVQCILNENLHILLFTGVPKEKLEMMGEEEHLVTQEIMKLMHPKASGVISVILVRILVYKKKKVKQNPLIRMTHCFSIFQKSLT